ncbi:MAG: cytochrome c3 family protein [Gemmatimonadales bacterium]
MLATTPCRGCHAEIVSAFEETAHFQTSALPSAERVKGPLAPDRSLLRTRSPDVFFEMSHQPDGYYQTAFDRRAQQSRTERIDLVIGSGRRGQTYLYWRNGLLLELPVSYLTAADAWINSPGYQDGTIDFSRVVPPRCLECHATTFRIEGVGPEAHYADDYQLGITCGKCHGDARVHLERQSTDPADEPTNILNPRRLDRARQLDNCGLCHSGPRRLRKPPFSFQPGLPLDEFLEPVTTDSTAVPDVHGDQVGLLALSRCFRQSPDLTCSTCHDVHRTQRDPAVFARVCVGCHEKARHRRPLTEAQAGGCVDCHMPKRASGGLDFNGAAATSRMEFRSHRIAVYPR